MDFCLEFARIRITMNGIMLSFHTYHFIYIYIYFIILILDIVLPRSIYWCLNSFIQDSLKMALWHQNMQEFLKLCIDCNPIICICWWI